VKTPAPLRVPAFRALWFAGTVSDAGDWLLFIALPVVVYRFTGSAIATSFIFLVELVPGVILAPVASWCGHRFDERRLLVLLSCAQALLLLPLLAVRDQADLPLLYAVIIAEAALLAVFDPVKNSVLPGLVPPADVVAANSLIGLGQNLARLVGGPLGGVLLATGGLSLVTVVDFVSYLGAALLLHRIRDLPVRQHSAPGRRRAARAGQVGGYRALMAQSQIRDNLVVAFITQAAQGIFLVLFVIFVERRLGGDAPEVGLLRGVQAVGAVIGALALTLFFKRWPARRLTAFATLCFGVFDVVLYVALFVIVGAPGVLLGTGLISSLQTEAPADQHLRAFAAFGAAANVGQAVGMLAAGILTTRLGLMSVLNAQAGLYLSAGLFAAVRSVGARRPGVRVDALRTWPTGSGVSSPDRASVSAVSK
jgi:predicted MFS family arabinose efflux permease